METLSPGKSYWKLNTEILQEEAYRLEIEKLISETETLKEYFPSVSDWWDHLKRLIKLVTIRYSIVRNTSKREELHQLTQRVDWLIKSPGENHTLEINQIRERIKEIDERAIKGLAIRARVERELLDEKCTQYFFSKIRNKRQRDNISQVRNNLGLVVHDQKGIENVFVEFYQTL